MSFQFCTKFSTWHLPNQCDGRRVIRMLSLLRGLMATPRCSSRVTKVQKGQDNEPFTAIKWKWLSQEPAGCSGWPWNSSLWEEDKRCWWQWTGVDSHAAAEGIDLARAWDPASEPPALPPAPLCDWLTVPLLNGASMIGVGGFPNRPLVKEQVSQGENRYLLWEVQTNRKTFQTLKFLSCTAAKHTSETQLATQTNDRFLSDPSPTATHFI